MKIKITIALLGLWLLMAFVPKGNDVFVCDNGKIGKYHYSKSCRGLNACKHAIVKMTLSEAKEQGYGLCGWED